MWTLPHTKNVTNLIQMLNTAGTVILLLAEAEDIKIWVSIEQLSETVLRNLKKKRIELSVKVLGSISNTKMKPNETRQTKRKK